jgi:OmpA-OmpF porin, OOP family
MLRRRKMTGLIFAAFLGVQGYHAVRAEDTPGPAAHFLYFPTGGKTLDAKDQNTVAEIAKTLEAHPDLFVTIVGKTDTVGSMEFNDKLAERRADAVFEALVYDNKVASSRIQVCWTGEHLPYINTGDQEEENRNRMVAIIVAKVESNAHFCYK